MNIEDLISQYIDGQLSSEAEAELHHRLAVSPEARKLFRSQIALRSIARDQRVLQTPAPELRSALFGRLQREEGMKPVEMAPPPAVAVTEVTRSIPSPAVRDGRRRRRAAIWLIPFITALLAVVIVWNGEDSKSIAPHSPTFADARPEKPQGADAKQGAEPDAVPSAAASSPSPAASSPSPAASSPAATATERSAAPAGRPFPQVEERARPATSAAKKESELIASADLADEGSGGASGGGAALGDRLALESEHAPSKPEDAKLDQRFRAADSPDFDKSQSPKLLSRQHGGNQNGASSDDRSLAFHITPTQTMGGKLKDSKQTEAQSLSPTVISSIPPPPPPAAPTLSGTDGVPLNSGSRPEQLIQASNMVTLGKQSSAPLLAAERKGAVADTVSSAFRDQSLGNGEGRNIPSSSPAVSSFGAAANASPISQGAVIAADASSSTSTDEPLSFAPGVPAVSIIVAIAPATYVSLSSGQVNLDAGFRAGVELRGRHQIYAVAGLSGYRNSISDSLISTTVNGVSTPSTRQADVRSAVASEVYGGIGYRYNLSIYRQVVISPGVWGTISGDHLRAGVEMPIAYSPSRWIRLEVSPTLRYVNTRAVPGEVSVGTVQTGQNASETSQRTTTPEATGGLDVGVGVGAVIVW